MFEIKPVYCSLFNSVANLFAMTPRPLTMPDNASKIFASSSALTRLIALRILSLFSEIADVTSSKFSCFTCSFGFSTRLILVIRSAIIDPPDFLGIRNLHDSIYFALEHCIVVCVVY